MWLAPLLLVAGVINVVNLAGTPQRIDDEGTYTAQAWAVDTLGELAHYTYWYDHPPLGWIQIAGYAQVTGAFERYDVSVIAAREAMVVAALISTGLVFWLCRRLRLGRPAAALAAGLFALSPLAIQYHRTVYLDNVATVWLLLALILATARHRQLAGFAASAACLGVAVLSKETYLLAIVPVAWVMIRQSHPSTRRYTLAVAGSVLGLIGISYLLLATVKGELFPGPDRVSLMGGVAFQLGGRASSGLATEAGSQISRTLSQWWHLDPVFITLGLLCAVIGIGIRRVRPFAVIVVALVLFMFRPGGYLPVPYVIMLLPLAAVAVAGVAHAAVERLRAGAGIRRAQGVAGILVLLAGGVVAVPVWGSLYAGQLTADLDRPSVEAQQWVARNVGKDQRLLVDDAMWVDLVRSGFARENVIWYYKLDTDSQVIAQSPNGWKDSDWIITTDSMRTFPDQFPQVKAAIANSTVVASFGSGQQRVDVRQIHAEGLAAGERADRALRTERAAVGAELAANPRLTLTPSARAQLRAGQVDSRVMLALAQQVMQTTLTITDFPAEDGTDGTYRRSALVTAVDGRPAVTGTDAARRITAWTSGLTGPFGHPAVTAADNGMTITYPLGEPENLLDPSLSKGTR
ncbi:hypothetical protein BGP79_05880 [Tersicoccus sp. Bi-70]|nr:hypothetical protein BGP79_05880 [Tersicoccus sp. Bi-70]